MKKWPGSAVPSSTTKVCVYGSWGFGDDHTVIVVFEDANGRELEARKMTEDAGIDLAEAWHRGTFERKEVN